MGHFIGVQMDTEETEETEDRHDSIMMVNGGVACLNQIACKAGWNSEAIDGSFTGSSEPVKDLVSQKIELALSKGRKVIVGFSVLGYNARHSIEIAGWLKDQFGSRIRVVCSGQHIHNFTTSPRLLCGTALTPFASAEGR